jgi:uncharacterized membrane protein
MSGSRQTQIVATRDEIVAQQHESDAPLVHVQQLERIHAFRPDLVNWIIQETEKEGAYRRHMTRRVNNYVFLERILGMVLAFIVGVAGIVGGGYIALNGQPTVGGTIATTTIGALAVAFLRGKSKNRDEEAE